MQATLPVATCKMDFRQDCSVQATMPLGTCKMDFRRECDVRATLPLAPHTWGDGQENGRCTGAMQIDAQQVGASRHVHVQAPRHDIQVKMHVLLEKYRQKKIRKESKTIAKSRCGRRVDDDTRTSDTTGADHGGEAYRYHMAMSLMEIRTSEGDTNISAAGVGGWREVELTFVSVACDMVMAVDMCPEIHIRESENQRKGLEYEVAKGDTIADEGERKFILMTAGAKPPNRIMCTSR